MSNPVHWWGARIGAVILAFFAGAGVGAIVLGVLIGLGRTFIWGEPPDVETLAEARARADLSRMAMGVCGLIGAYFMAAHLAAAAQRAKAARAPGE